MGFNEEVHHNTSAGVILSANSLVLQGVERSSAGTYTCSATNTQGTQRSNPVRLDIMYSLVELFANSSFILYPFSIFQRPPTSFSEPLRRQVVIRTTKQEATFLWRLNGSERTYKSKSEQLAWGHLVSQFTFVGTSDKDYGALMCWANNSIGTQEKPCVFQIIPAGPPSSPEHCEIINNTAENIEVLCEHGFDGGMRQSFLAEVYDEGGSLHLNRSSDEPQWSVESLKPGTSYTIRISAFNAKGRSPTIILTAATLKVAEQRVGENKSLLSSPLIIIFVSILGVFLFLILILVLVTRWRKNNNTGGTSGSASVVASSKSSPPVEGQAGGGGGGGGGVCKKRAKEEGMTDKEGWARTKGWRNSNSNSNSRKQANRRRKLLLWKTGRTELD
ncbi:uncharacterized protein LOC119572446 [Penaeus monodon]|uniref:uncharacterized protein LOC119572446 n=1 Tax=Penaeus monodon TaxID=6687 RepID=UPI0018A6D72B|nr:uncharacterized protein LOC119572446 [Penaeus monodon]